MMPSIVLTVGLDQAIFDLGFDFAFSFGASVSASRESWGGGGLFGHLGLLLIAAFPAEPSGQQHNTRTRRVGCLSLRRSPRCRHSFRHPRPLPPDVAQRRRIDAAQLGRAGSRNHAGAVLGDEVMAAARIDRLLHHCHIVNICGKSYRMRHREQRRSMQRSEADGDGGQAAAILRWTHGTRVLNPSRNAAWFSRVSKQTNPHPSGHFQPPQAQPRAGGCPRREGDVRGGAAAPDP